jgi:hypothetical protein
MEEKGATPRTTSNESLDLPGCQIASEQRELFCASAIFCTRRP